MKTTYEELKKLRLMAEKSFKKKNQLDKLLTMIETKLSRAEARKDSDEKQK